VVHWILPSVTTRSSPRLWQFLIDLGLGRQEWQIKHSFMPRTLMMEVIEKQGLQVLGRDLLMCTLTFL